MKTNDQFSALLEMREEYSRLPNSFSQLFLKGIDNKLDHYQEVEAMNQELPSLSTKDEYPCVEYQ